MEESKRFSVGIYQARAPFVPELRNFMANSRKFQTLYSNCEGAYSRRVVKKGEEVYLCDYIYNTLYSEDGRRRLDETDENKIRQVKTIQNRMMRISERHHSDGEVHFTAVWVFYFHYGLKKLKGTPVFKIYKSKKRTDAIFVDVDATEYESWDCYLERAEFPESFLCVPRHGEYYFDEEERKLDLEFLNSSLTDESRPRQSPSARRKSTFPLSHIMVHPLIIKIKELPKKLQEEIRSFVVNLGKFWNKYKTPLTAACVFVLAVAIEFYQPGLLRLLPVTDLALMFLNTQKELPEEIYKSVTFTEVPRNIVPEYTSEAAEFQQLLGEEKKNWSRIFQLFCSFLAKNRNYVAVLNILPAPLPVVRLVNAIFASAHVLQNMKLLNPTENCPVATKSNGGGVSVEKASTSSDAGAVEGEGMSLEKLLPFLESLETDCPSSIREMILRNPGRASTMQGARPSGRTSPGVFVIEEFALFFADDVSGPRLATQIRQFLRRDFRLEQIMDRLQIVTDLSGKELGILYFPSKFATICLFPLEFSRG